MKTIDFRQASRRFRQAEELSDQMGKAKHSDRNISYGQGDKYREAKQLEKMREAHQIEKIMAEGLWNRFQDFSAQILGFQSMNSASIALPSAFLVTLALKT